MTRNFSKVTAALLATLTISAAATSITTDIASAGMRGERMAQTNHMTHRGHNYRHNGYGFGGALAVGLIIAAANQPYAESYDPQTGERVRSSGKPGRHVIVRTDGKGNVDRKVENRGPDSASSTDTKTGQTTTSTSNGDGTRTVVQTDASGKVLSSEVVQ